MLDNREKLISIEYTLDERKENCLSTITYMLMNRRTIPNNDETYQKVYNAFKTSLKKNTDNEAIYINNDNKYIVKFIDRSITTIKKTPELELFLDNNSNAYKFLIANDISEKIKKTIINIKNLELFTYSQVIKNIIEHHLVPKHRLLTEDEKNQFIQEYDIKNKDMPRIFNNDPISKYYNAKIGDIFEIERISYTAGITVSYRLVVAGIMT